MQPRGQAPVTHLHTQMNTWRNGNGGNGAALFAIDFNQGAVSIATVMRAPLCVVNERRQQMAGLCQAHLRVRPAGCIPVIAP
jgi:hypothetical protein